MTNINAKMI